MSADQKPTPPLRRANRTQAAEFFGVEPTTLDGWIRKGAPVVRRGSRGVACEIDLLALAEWRFADSAGTGDLAEARARHDYWRAKLAEQEFNKRAGLLLDRAQVEQESARLFAMIAQTIRSWPDNLERIAGLTPEQAEAIEQMVDGLCLTIMGRVQALTGPPASTDSEANRVNAV